jgi:hypothetical protein
MRPPAAIVPAERYFACGGVFNGWILCYTRSDYGIRARTFSSARPNRLKDNVATGAYIRLKSRSIIYLVLAIILSLYAALDLTWVALTIPLKKATAQYLTKAWTSQLSCTSGERARLAAKKEIFGLTRPAKYEKNLKELLLGLSDLASLSFPMSPLET